MFDDDEAVLRVLKEEAIKEAADETENEDVTLHGGDVKKYSLGLWSRLMALPTNPA